MLDVSPQKLVKFADSPIYRPKSIASDGIGKGFDVPGQRWHGHLFKEIT